MFLNSLKNLFTKKIVKKSLANVKPGASGEKINTVGIVFDESYFHEKEAIVEALSEQGILPQNTDVLVFKNRIRKNEVFDYPVFSHKDLSWQATFRNSDVKAFMEKPFDLLINYYDVEKSALMVVTNLSKAKFKVGFASVSKKLNHFMIDTTAERHEVFTSELFKYLKILNKL
ncbi:hypothetical protein HUK80_15250 [Flavobacterium sp. MAH-1]|uniref:Uncharacterized protein n=1 Tax=Flavobacterium agri TaxID=2743471 RepID=A0A7Y8Y469_9FLAO|nr:hypothetical protein [Flavobacterium agri]NUY82260.1 hypothetical protein [Flavobacterium agri]NYA72284.1 hypothetical protein [Flavobacterium agri]